MEPIGLGLGIAGLAGLFSTCVQCFKIFDIEKTRLLQWGEGVGLSRCDSPSQHPRLSINSSRRAIESVLNCIKLLLTDAEKLRQKYGIDVEREGESGIMISNKDMISQSRLESFRKSFARFCNHMDLQQKQTNVLAKIKWAIRDCEAFTTLVADMRNLVEGLYKLAPIAPDVERLMIQEDFDTLSKDLGRLRLLEEACSERNDNWSDMASVQLEASDLATQDRRVIEWIDDTTMTSLEDGLVSKAQEVESDVISGNRVPSFRAFKRHRSEEEASDSEVEIRAIKRLDRSNHNRNANRSWTFFLDFSFERDLIRHGIIPEGHKSLKGSTTTKPSNLEEIVHIMRQEQPSVLTSLLSSDVYERFQKSNQLSMHKDVENLMISLITTDIDPECYSRSIRFSSLDPLIDGNSLKAAPDLSVGFRSESLHSGILEKLSGFIEPNNRQLCPIMPTCFLELESTTSNPQRLKRQAYYNGALGARGLLRIQSYGRPEFLSAGNAYTFTSTLFDGILRIFAVYPTNSGDTSNTEYHIISLGAWILTNSQENFQAGITSFLNIKNWAYCKGLGFIEAANERLDTDDKN